LQRSTLRLSVPWRALPPILVDVSEEFAERLGTGEWLALRDREGIVVATMKSR
jgi:hypothetical protein